MSKIKILFLLFVVLNIETIFLFLFDRNVKNYIPIENIFALSFLLFTRKKIFHYGLYSLLFFLFFLEIIPNTFKNLNKLNIYDSLILIKNLDNNWKIISAIFFIAVITILIAKTEILFRLTKNITPSQHLLLLTFISTLLVIDFYKDGKQNILQSRILNYQNRYLDIEGPLFFDKTSIRLLPWNHETATDNLLSSINKKKALVIVESWGIPKNKEIINSQIEIFSEIKNAKVTYKEIKFSGSTIHAEIRELCRLFPNSTTIDSIPNSSECIPNLLKNKGYKTFAYHAGNGDYYQRKYWYPEIGFDQILFFSEDAKFRNCYSWAGHCDIDLAELFFKNIKKHEKSFSYWMTLNSHAPYDKRDIKISQINDCKKVNEETNSSICHNYLIIRDLFLTIKKGLFDLEDIEIFIVGDHPPPFFLPSDRERYGKIDLVPSIHIKIN
ncbi:MAG: sulfatase-like hydrolase/transferase [Comamonas sp.]|nr:sulfatase-like hydrolase/transferase [Comamonas sp.]